MPDGRRKRSEFSRAKILLAVRLLMREGNFRPTVRQVAHSAGVSMRTVFGYYEDHNNLLKAALDEDTSWDIADQVLRCSHDLGPIAVERMVHAVVFGMAMAPPVDPIP